jgi:hypothetical protein
MMFQMKRSLSLDFQRKRLALGAVIAIAFAFTGCTSSSNDTPSGAGGGGGVAASQAGSLGAGTSGGVSNSGGATTIATSNGGANGVSGGATGSGGTPVGAGNAGSPSAGFGTGGTSAGLGGATGGCPANAIFCADFESGSIPSNAVYSPAYQQPMMAMYMTVDGTVAHGGSHSLKVTPNGNFSQMLGVTTGTPTFWTRFYLRQDINTNTVTGHDTFVAATDQVGAASNAEYVRIGEHSCQLEVNRASDDKEILSDAVAGNSNYACAGGITFAPNTWYCVEAFYDGANSALRVFVDSAEVSALHVTNWGPYMYRTFEFGFENYGGTSRTLWYDDVVVAPQQVGCD